MTFAKPNGGALYDFKIDGDHLVPIPGQNLLNELINIKLKTLIDAKYKRVTSAIALSHLPTHVDVILHGTPKTIKIT